jgi:homogentisate 1,2-dioxygenase
MGKDNTYMSGFGNEFASEAASGALPKYQNSPQKAPLGLFAEQLSGSAFTAPGRENQRSWLYRMVPSVKQKPYKKFSVPLALSAPFFEANTPPDPLRWLEMPYPKKKQDFIESWFTYCANGDVRAQAGNAVHMYAAAKSMDDRCFYNADGDLLIVPQEGALQIKTEFGLLDVGPKEIAVIQRGIKFQVALPNGKARGYICENYGAHFVLPYRGPIGANGLANSRDFLTPVAAFDKKNSNVKMEMITKFNGSFFASELAQSPFDVVAWHGNYAPYKYDLRLFNTMNTVSFDHPDPSIFTVLTSQTTVPGVANVDFVIFPPRWMVAEDTFRPPYFHRNIMSEFMGLVYGVYDAKPAGGFVPGGASLHNCMTAHGPETEAFELATNATLKPQKLDDTLAFMFESNLVYQTPAQSLGAKWIDKKYYECWQDLKSNF